MTLARDGSAWKRDDSKTVGNQSVLLLNDASMRIGGTDNMISPVLNTFGNVLISVA